MTIGLLEVVYLLILLGGLFAAALVALGRGREPIRLIGMALLMLVAYLAVQFVASLF